MSNLNETIIRETFGQAYNRDKFTRFTREILTGIQERGTTHVQIPTQFKDYIQSYYRVGKYVYNDGFEKIIDVLEVKLKKNSSIEHARAMQRNFVARYLNGAFGDIKRDAALVAFISEDAKDWRFSFVKMDYKSQIITQENGKQKRIIEKELTPAKRFSFLVGENEDIHTAQKQLFDCLSKASSGKQITLEDLVEAFDIEKVSKEFFAEYKKLYIRLRDELKRIYDFDIKIHKDFDDHDINIDDFAKKTLGQLVFLYFIQKKGWLGVETGKIWGTGDKRFLRNLFDKKYIEYDNFFNNILEPLFYRALARDRGNENDNFAPLGCRIPFLNGGLFEPINGYGYAQTNLTINNAVFKEIFDVFDLYNFTVKEDEPLEKEVAIDPEMLGKVFENLLPENERKGNGAFYTPREIVHYMCQESLINYLYNAVNTEKLNQSQAKQNVLFTKKKAKQPNLDLEKFEEIISKDDISSFIKLGESTYTNSSQGINEDFPSSIKENAIKINQALKNIKICDPAIGSGAFPVGMMNEIVRIRLALGVENKTAYQIKREIIENNLYGVDLDEGAVEIAKLRFWLSLIVDEEDISNIKPLPNLDYKVMQGNSLISSYEGIDFDEIVEDYKPTNVQLDFDYFGTQTDNIITNINNLMYQYIKVSHDTEKQEIRNKIEQEIVNLVKSKVEEKAKQGGIKWEQAEQTIRDFAQSNKHRNFFPWKLFFADVFINGGFDIVIGNPPYISTKGVDAKDKVLYEKEFGFSDDTYNLFFFKGYSSLKYNGILTYITPKTFWTTQTKRNLRNLLLSQKINFIFDTANPFEAAMVDTCVTSMQNNIKSYDSKIQKSVINNWTNHKCNEATQLMYDEAYKKGEKYKIDFLDGTQDLERPEMYQIAQNIYLNTQNAVIFKPTDLNLRIYEKYGERVKKLYDTWWSKIETSKKISQNQEELTRYRNSLRPGDIALLGCLTEGGQGLATANNGKYIAVRKSTKWANNIIQSRPKKLEEAVNKYHIPSAELKNMSPSEYIDNSSESEIIELFDRLKEKYGRDIFGQGYIYRLIDDDEIANVDELTENEKENGIDISKKYYVPYDKGDKDGNRWYLETPFAIAWSKENVHFLKTNSGKKGAGMPVVRNPQFNFREGFCWSDINTTYLKCRKKDKSINDVKSMSMYGISEKVPEYYIVSLINSSFISEYVNDFINNTQTFQINDARQLPIIVPNSEQLDSIYLLYMEAIKIKKNFFQDKNIALCNKLLLDIQEKLDRIVKELYTV